MKKARASLIASVAIGLLAISTAGVSTYAWFQANASATINATSASTTITVSKPDDYTFYAYKGNKLDSWDSSGTFNNDFVALTTSSLVNTYTSFEGIYPGKNMIFALSISSASSAEIEIRKIKSNDSNMEGLSQNRYVAGTSNGTLINIGWAIDIYSTCVSVTTSTVPAYANYSSFISDPSSGNEDQFLYDELSNDSAHHRATYLAASSTTNNVITLSNPISIFDENSLDPTKDTFIFYSVTFSNSNTTYFNEVSAATESSGTPTIIDIVPASGSRYFKKATAGNSNCYGGLSFALPELALLINE